MSTKTSHGAALARFPSLRDLEWCGRNWKAPSWLDRRPEVRVRVV